MSLFSALRVSPDEDIGRSFRSDTIARAAERALRLELETYPKPGLVSPIDSGSHADMDARTFRASNAAITPFFRDLATAGAEGAGMPVLRRIGLDAEAAMRAATGGVNTHRGDFRARSSVRRGRSLDPSGRRGARRPRARPLRDGDPRRSGTAARSGSAGASPPPGRRRAGRGGCRVSQPLLRRPAGPPARPADPSRR